MEQKALYSAIKEAGFSVVMFEDHPQFFGNWRAIFKRRSQTYEVVSDNREGWLSLWRLEDKQGVRLFEVESTRLGQDQELAQLIQWLAHVKGGEHAV
jgi:hypothetical protein